MVISDMANDTIGDGIYSYTETMHYQVLYDQTIFRTEEMVVETKGDFSSVAECYKSGRQYFDNGEKYFDIDNTFDPECAYPMTYRIDTVPVLESGKLQLVGQGGETLLLEVTGDNVVTISVGPLTKTIDVTDSVEEFISGLYD